jgi:hypothetical protein
MLLSNHTVCLEAPLRGLKARQKPCTGVDERLPGGGDLRYISGADHV